MASETVTVPANTHVDLVAESSLSGKLMIQNRKREVKHQGRYVVCVKPVAGKPADDAEGGVLLAPLGDIIFDGEAALWARSLSGADIDVEVIEAA